jgi:hypothetical protein
MASQDRRDCSCTSLQHSQHIQITLDAETLGILIFLFVFIRIIEPQEIKANYQILVEY